MWYNQFNSIGRLPVILTSRQQCRQLFLWKIISFCHTMTRVAQKGAIITREQYKKICCSESFQKRLLLHILSNSRWHFTWLQNQKQSLSVWAAAASQIHYVESRDSTLLKSSLWALCLRWQLTEKRRQPSDFRINVVYRAVLRKMQILH